MSSQRGNVNRTRPQKHKNSKAFKNNLHDTTQKIKMLNTLEVTGCCARCKDIIDWKIKYKKYKPLTQPKTCVTCKQKTVKKAYYLLCESCAKAKNVCAKCGDKQEIVQQPGLSTAEEHRQQAMFQLELKSLSEKQRRKFLRLMASGKLKSGEMPSTTNMDGESDHESDAEDMDEDSGHGDETVSGEDEQSGAQACGGAETTVQ